MVSDSSGRAAGCVRATLSFSNYITGNTGPCATDHRNFFTFEFRIIIAHYALAHRDGWTCVSLNRYCYIWDMSSNCKHIFYVIIYVLSTTLP